MPPEQEQPRARDDGITRLCGSLMQWLSVENPLPSPVSPRYQDHVNRDLQVFREENAIPSLLKSGPSVAITSTSSLEQSPSMAQKLASLGNSVAGVSQRSQNTWSISDIEDTRAERASAASPVQPPGLARLPGLETSMHAPRPVKGEENLLGSWLRLLNRADDASIASEPPIDYPETERSPIEGPCRDQKDIGWRQLNMTSELQIVRELRSRQRLAEQIRETIRQSTAHVEALAATPMEEPAWPKAQCVLREANDDDVSQITEILNKERLASHCPQVFSVKPFTNNNVREIIRRCQLHMLPFVVAVPAEEDLLDRSKWPKNSEKAYREYVTFKQSHPSPPPSVVGFAFVTDARLGLMCSPCPSSRWNAQVRIVVDPEHRRHKYGTALLDRVLLSLSPYHQSLIEYEWKQPSSTGVYGSLAVQNERQYTRIYVEVFCQGKHQPNYQWRTEMLKAFHFKEAAFLHDAARTTTSGECKWLDLSLWELEAQTPAAVQERARSSVLSASPSARTKGKSSLHQHAKRG